MRYTTRQLSELLMAWYDHNRRAFPWRALQGETPDPYRVWLSEIMLQQTGTAAAAAYFNKFTARWPDVHALANADLDAVLTGWAGLGYYARARNLHACAKIVSTQMDGVFPRDCAALLKLPGVGPYTAAAIAAIAYDLPAPVLDGNIERVMARLHAVTAPLPGAKPVLRGLSLALIDCGRPGDAAQAMMDLGALICTPRAPDCPRCPWRSCCAAFEQNIAQSLPVKPRKAPGPTRLGAVFWLTRHDGAVLLRRRPERGLLGGMLEFPGTPWGTELPKTPEINDAAPYAPVACNWRELPGVVRHVFTHFKLELTVYAGEADAPEVADGFWAQPGRLGDLALPSLMQKVAAHAAASMKETIV